MGSRGEAASKGVERHPLGNVGLNRLKDKRKVEARLDAELTKLKELFDYGDRLKVRWIPNENSKVFGEVKGGTILLYVEGEEAAVKSLRHEFIDSLLTEQVINPFLKFINLQKCFIEDLIYDRKEKMVNKILNLI